MCCVRGMQHLSVGVLLMLGFFFFCCSMSKCKHLVQVSGRDSNRVKATIYIIFYLTTDARMRSKVLILLCQLNIHEGKGV